MKRSLTFFKRPATLAILLALMLTLTVVGVAGAAPVTSRTAPLSSPSTCVSATPPLQQVAVDQAANVNISLSCLLWVEASWGDGTTSLYAPCVQACVVPLPPSTFNEAIIATHTYTIPGNYYTKICTLTTSLPSTAYGCTMVEIEVV